MSSVLGKNFNLPWHQYDQYWITLFAKNGQFSPQLTNLLLQIGMQAVSAGVMSVQTPRDWKTTWDALYAAVEKAGLLNELSVVLTPDAPPSYTNTALERRSTADIKALADSLWLGTALLEDRVMCYLQPVISSQDKVFGYESFARVKAHDGSIIAGDKIVAASRALNIEFMIDRHLQVCAVKTFISSDFDGFLFINFFAGFIHRPAVYLEGLNATVKSYGVVAKHIVLEFTQSEMTQDIEHMKNICEYGRSCGYSVALDDIESLEGARKLVPVIRPDFLKIDMHLARMVNEARGRDIIKQVVELVHSNGGIVVAEGVENDEMRSKLRQLGVDLFQGYLFSPPMPAEAVLRRYSTGNVG
ncbi:MAG: EAL domain-containing protein [Rickettsiales bacterium]|nr:EAL domain-containing protein [Rickettsiales bacterium]